MWIKIGVTAFIVLAVYFLILTLIAKFSNKKDDKKKNESSEKEFNQTLKPRQAVKTVVIKAVKNNINNLPNITKHYIFDDSKTALSSEKKITVSEEEKQEEMPQFQVEVTINDESIITDMEDNSTLDDLEKMAELMKQMASGDVQEETGEGERKTSQSDYEYQDIDDNLIADFFKTDFLTNNEETI